MTGRRRIMNTIEGKPVPEKSCLSTPTVYHAAVVIFLEFFAFGLLTTPMITVLNETFPKHTFLMNGIIQGIKGFLSFLSAPLLGALSDALGRKPFLLLTVTFTCCPLPLMKISHWWYFTMISISGIFSVTFSVVLAYVADITSDEERSWGYGLVSATFAASLVTSPAIGAYLGQVFNDEIVVALATAVAFLDLFFIMAFVPESLPEKVRASNICSSSGRSSTSGGAGAISWDKVDPFAALRKVTNDHLVLIICITTFFSYLPEAGQYSCFFVYLRLVMGFSEENVALFIAFGGILSCISQTLILTLLNHCLGAKRAIMVGLTLEAVQLTLYGFSTKPLFLWVAGLVAAMGSVTYPALSAFVSKHAAADQQGVAQGLVAGIRGLCGGLGPALFGLIFYVFRVDLHKLDGDTASVTVSSGVPHEPLQELQEQFLPGPPFAFGAILVLIAILVSCLIPENPHTTIDGVAYGLVSTDRDAHEAPDSSIISPATAGGRLRRYPDFTFSELKSSRSLFDNDRYTEDKEFLLNYDKLHTKLHHGSGVSEPGFLNRLLYGWRESRAAPTVKRPPRLFRKSPTVSFTKARFVEPLRRFLGGLSGSHSTDSGPIILPGFYSPTSMATLSHRTPSLLLRHYADESREAEAADLSNYRSHNWRDLLHSSPPPSVTSCESLHSSSLKGNATLGVINTTGVESDQIITAKRFESGGVFRVLSSRSEAAEEDKCNSTISPSVPHQWLAQPGDTDHPTVDLSSACMSPHSDSIQLIHPLVQRVSV